MSEFADRFDKLVIYNVWYRTLAEMEEAGNELSPEINQKIGELLSLLSAEAVVQLEYFKELDRESVGPDTTGELRADDERSDDIRDTESSRV